MTGWIRSCVTVAVHTRVRRRGARGEVVGDGQHRNRQRLEVLDQVHVVASDLPGDEQAVGHGHREGGQLAGARLVEVGEVLGVGRDHLVEGLTPRVQEHGAGGGLVGSALEREHETQPEKSGDSRSARPVRRISARMISRRDAPVFDLHWGAHAGDPLDPAALDDGGEERVLVLEVPVDRARRQTRPFAHQGDAGPLVAPLAGDRGRGGEDLLPGLISVGAPPSRFGC